MPPPKMSKSTPWSVAADWALLLTLLLTVSIMVLCSELCTTSIMASGESSVAYAPDGSLTLDGTDTDPVIGSVQWKGAYRECGWPFPILRRSLPITASWTLDDPPETVASRVVPADHPLAAALDRELSERSLPDWYMDSIRSGGDEVGDATMLWTNAIFSLGLIWMVLYAIARIPMVFLRAQARVLHDSENSAGSAQQEVQESCQKLLPASNSCLDPVRQVGPVKLWGPGSPPVWTAVGLMCLHLLSRSHIR